MKRLAALVSLVLLGESLLAGESATNTPSLRSATDNLAVTQPTRPILRRAASPVAANTNLTLVWRKKPDSVDAQIRRQPLTRVLPAIARATGWQVFIEPGVESTITSGFRGLPSREALERILSGFNYAVLRSTNARPRLVVFETAASKATRAIRPDDENRVENEIVALIAPGSSLTAEELAKRTGGELAGKIAALNAALLRYPDAAATDAARDKLASLDGVSLDDNRRLPNTDTAEPFTSNSPTTPLAIRPANADSGRLVIGLIDTAVQPLTPEYEAFLVGRESVAGQASANPDLAHGTTMFENMIKAAESTTGRSGGAVHFGVLSVDVYGPNETTTAFDVALGIQRAVEKNANVINLSLSSDLDAPYLHQLIGAYRQQGVLFLAAAGNEPTVQPTFPASYPEVIAVSAGSSSGQFAPYANRGPFVDLMLPGSGIVAFQGDRWLVNGTSTATAYASGIAGALWTPSIGSPANLEPLLRQNFGIKP